MKRITKRIIYISILSIIAIGLAYYFNKKSQPYDPNFGKIVDSLNGVYVYYNGSVSNVSGRNKSTDGYNIGLKYQCVEFVKRYYYEFLNHKMPDSYGHAVDFFDLTLHDSTYNSKRDLIQFTNNSIK